MKLFNFSDGLLAKKNVISIVVIIILILAIVAGVKLVKTQQQLRSKAAGEGVVDIVQDANTTCQNNGCTTTSNTIYLDIKAPDF